VLSLRDKSDHPVAGPSGEPAARGNPPVTIGTEAANLIGRYDHVTRLPNRLEFLEHFTRLRGGRGDDRMLVLVSLTEARYFGEIQRALGHAFSEDLVRAGASLLADILPANWPIYHVSALSFAFVVDAEGTDAIPPIVGTIVSAFSGPIDVNDIPIKTHVGTGLLPLSPAITDAAEALRATLAAAQDSRNVAAGFAFYNHHIDAAQIRAFRLLTDLPAALAAPDQLTLNFQPRLNLATGACVGAEALLRWNHPQLGPISPGDFVPLAEQTAFITPLTDWVFNAALAETRRFAGTGRALTISINASPLNLSEPGFDERLLDLCRAHDVAPTSIELEFTEGVLASNGQRVASHLTRLRAAGVKVAIDDFGSGYSSLNYLTSIPADILKIDQSFVRPLGTDPAGEFIVRQIIALGKGLGFKLCAEGIETQMAYDLLREMECDEGQGYLMARPLAADAFLNWVDEHEAEADVGS
jgi:EAL domain-containing protein (putative c-di-GMP-specific phosphodiesterase class I)/GGDEF domain-containing protein